MYLPSHFEERRLEVLHGLIRACPLAAIVTPTAGGIDANHIPVDLYPELGPLGALRGHMARSNPMWRERLEQAEALAIFQGADGYISPSWYPTKREHGKVVPTWNYVVVHAYGPLRVIDDPAWLRSQLEALVARHEAGSAAPWAISDAPPDYIERMIASIVGFEIDIRRLVGKWKVSQNQPAQNRTAVAEALAQRGGEPALQMAQLVREGGRDGG
jgi:transcriptional regulator